MGIWHSDPGVTPVDELKSEAGTLVPDSFTIDDPVAFVQRLPAGEYAVATHIGTYDGLGGAWDELFGQWLPLSGREMAEGPTFEVYLDNCSVVPSHECRTELHIRLKTPS